MELSDLTQAGERVEKISVDSCLNLYSHIPIIDVRSPGEFEKAHIIGAHSIPLFNNEERAMVGTAYKRKSREKAIALGYELVQPKLQHYIDEAQKIAPNGEVTVHCWRGGMRSAAFARHLSENGFHTVRLIEGGYKAYRHEVHEYFKLDFDLNTIGGFTGSGKTEILKYLKQQGLQVLDLEALANHRGSAFGGIDLPQQPSVEMFENLLFDELRKFDRNQKIWVEDESQYIGSVFIPHDFFKNIKEQMLYFINIPREERAKHLVHMYSHLNAEGLAESIRKISKRLGHNHAKEALEHLEKKEYFEVVKICLTYYDKFYLKGLSMRDQKKVKEYPFPLSDHIQNAQELYRLITLEN